jgi:hypothetical protein
MWDLGISTVMLIRQDARADQPLDYSAKFRGTSLQREKIGETTGAGASGTSSGKAPGGKLL